MPTDKQRADLLVSHQLQVTRKTANNWIKAGWITLANNRLVTKPSQLLAAQQTVVFHGEKSVLAQAQAAVVEQKVSNENQPLPVWNHPLQIVFEDTYFWVVNKPSGILVHPNNYEQKNTLANIMQGYFVKQNLANFGEFNRCGIVHRLDKDTAGLLVVAKNELAYEKLTNLFKRNYVTKKYYGLLTGHLVSEVVEVKAPILKQKDGIKRMVSKAYEAKKAWSIFKEITKYKGFSLVEITIKTGRTHQIRVHAEYIHNPVVNDPLYGLKSGLKTVTQPVLHQNYNQYLFAYYLAFKHPFTNQKVVFEAPLPTEFMEYCKKYG